MNTHGFKFWEWVLASPSQKARMIAIERKIEEMQEPGYFRREYERTREGG